MFSNEVIIHEIAVPFSKLADQYFAKLMLKKYLDETDTSLDEDIVYLDYDHVFCDSMQINIMNAQHVYLSSETEPISSALLPTKSTKQLKLPPLHYNTSMIMGKAGILAKTMDRWERTYFEYQEFVSPRYIEEVSFCGSAMAQEVKVVPVSTCIQSNWQNISSTWQMFHYGGEYRRAKKLKEIIPAFLGHTLSIESKKKAFLMSEKIVKALSRK